MRCDLDDIGGRSSGALRTGGRARRVVPASASVALHGGALAVLILCSGHAASPLEEVTPVAVVTEVEETTPSAAVSPVQPPQPPPSRPRPVAAPTPRPALESRRPAAAPSPAAAVEDETVPSAPFSSPSPAPSVPAAKTDGATGAMVPEITPLSRVEPVYPPRALMARQEGSVVLEFTVTAEGGVADPHVIRSSPPGVFDHAALAAVGRWRFARDRSGKARVTLFFRIAS